MPVDRMKSISASSLSCGQSDNPECRSAACRRAWDAGHRLRPGDPSATGNTPADRPPGPPPMMADASCRSKVRNPAAWCRSAWSHGETLDAADVDRIVHHAAAAVGLARVLADIAAGGREGVVLADQAHGVIVTAGTHECNVARNIHSGRAQCHTGHRMIPSRTGSGRCSTWER